MARDLQDSFKDYNRRFFDNKLPKVPVRWSRTIPSDTVGEFRWGLASRTTMDIRLDREMRRHRNYWRWVLLHEMAHLKLQLRYPRMTNEEAHGPRWQKEMRRLARIGAFSDIW